MSEQFQSGQHPNADQLSAFVERALPLHEQQQILTHIAVCADCRSIVYLSQDLAIHDSPAPLAPPAEIPRRSWFSGWALAWPAAAAFACLILATVLMRNLSVHKGEHETTSASVSTTPKAVAGAPNVPQGPSPARPVHEKPRVLPRSVGASIPPTVAATQQTHSASPDLKHGERIQELPLNDRNAPNIVSPHGVGAGSGGGIGSGVGLGVGSGSGTPKVAAENKLENQNANAGAMLMQQLSTSRQNAAAAPAPPSGSLPVRSALQSPLTLPSQLATVSMISRENQILAIDAAGTLFFSQDAGQHWTTIRPRWTGRAVKVNFVPSIVNGRRGALADTVTPKSSGAILGAIVGGVPQAAPRGTSTLMGVVTDTSGAAISNATVVVINNKTSQVQTAKTDDSGRYAVMRLAPGSYQMAAQSPGFRTRVLDGIMVDVSKQARVNFTLDVGSTTETVEVTAQAPMLQAESSSTETLIENKKSSGAKLPAFELITDTGAVWISSDGRKWTRE